MLDSADKTREKDQRRPLRGGVFFCGRCGSCVLGGGFPAGFHVTKDDCRNIDRSYDILRAVFIRPQLIAVIPK